MRDIFDRGGIGVVLIGTAWRRAAPVRCRGGHPTPLEASRLTWITLPGCLLPSDAGLGSHPSNGAGAGAEVVGKAASPMNDVTRILFAIEHGDPNAAEQRLPLVYDELRTLAAQKLAQEKPGQTLQATALESTNL